MDASFTEREKRFVLAEMIKSSHIDVEALAMFVRANHVEPDWMSMQLPHGRNMKQCVQAAEHMALSTSSMKRRLSSGQPEFLQKRIATLDRPEYVPSTPIVHHGNFHLPPPTASHVAILPRPTNGDHRETHLQVTAEPPRKRGRPSRADKAKRDLHPLLPRPPMPMASQAGPISSASQARESMIPASANALAPLAPKRTAVPALLASPISATRPITPPEAYVATTQYSGSPRRRLSTVSPREEPRGAHRARLTESEASASPTKRLAD